MTGLIKQEQKKWKNNDFEDIGLAFIRLAEILKEIAHDAINKSESGADEKRECQVRFEKLLNKG